MKLIYHADDFGLSSGINRGILECYDQGVLQATSIIPNGYAVDEALEAYHQRKDLLLSVHLNFIEGKAFCPEAVPFLVDREGFFNQSFMDLLRLSNKVCGVERLSVTAGIKDEMKAQINRIRPYLKSGAPLRIDSHQHTHCIPVFFETLMEVAMEIPIDHIRTPRDQLFFPTKSLSLFIQSIGVNQLKVRLLNMLIRSIQGKWKKGISTNDFFIGVLFTGKMSPEAIELSMKRIEKKSNEASVVEILYHPGQAAANEKPYWKKYPNLWKYYISEDREKERMNFLK